MARVSHHISSDRIKELQVSLQSMDYIDKAVVSLASILSREICDETDATSRTITKHIERKKSQNKNTSRKTTAQSGKQRKKSSR